MPTYHIVCGLECGITGTGSHFPTLTGGASIVTSKKRTGNRALRFNTTSSTATAALNILTSSTRWVGRFYVWFDTLPNASIKIVLVDNTNGPCVFFNSSDNKIYARVTSTNGATGVSVSTGSWILIDFDFNISTGGNDLCDVKVNGTACGQATATGLSAAVSSMQFGTDASATADYYMDDFAVSVTGADYPIGAGKVEHYTVTSDGTHNIAGTGDFQHGTAGTDITNSTTDAFQLVDDIPLPTSITTSDLIAGIAPPNPTTDYVECKFGPASGISAAVSPPRGVQWILNHHQAGTQAGQWQLKMNCIGGNSTVFDTGSANGVTSLRTATGHMALAPGSVAWNLDAGNNGDFNSLKMRFLCPDANPDQYLDAIMLEVEFPEAGNQTVTPGAATLTLTGFAPQLKQTVTVPKADLSLTTFAPTLTQGKTVTPPNASLTLTKFAPQLQQKVTVPSRSMSLTTFAPAARVNQILTVPKRDLAFTTFAPQLRQVLTPASRSLALTTFAPRLQQRITVPARSLTFSTFAPQLKQQITPASRTLNLTTFAPSIVQSGRVTPGNATLTLTTFSPQLRQTVTVPNRALSLTTFAPSATVGITATPTAASISLTTFAPQLRQQTTPAPATLTLTAFAPRIGLSVVPGAANVSLTGFAPQLRTVLTPQPASLTLTTFAPTLETDITVTPLNATLTLTTFAPSAQNPVTVTPGARSVTLTPFAPVLQSKVTVPAQALNMTRFAPVLQFTNTPAAASLTLQTFAPQLQGAILVPSRTLTLIRYAPDIFVQTDEAETRTLDGRSYAIIPNSNIGQFGVGSSVSSVKVRNGR